MSNKHLRPDETPVELKDDLDENPGIGQSKGLFARTGADASDAGLIEGDSTVQGDIENDSSAGDGADGRRLGRTNP
jgi:hypothetical protein